jgi:outer membrane protein OmpA-like peptidoglycan-associated protein
MRCKFLSIVTLFFLIPSFLWAQDHSVKPSSYLPQNLGKSINTDYYEINPIISLDGKTLFFNRINDPQNHYGKHDSQDIWVSYLQSDGSWSQAKRLETPFNLARHNAILCALSNDSYLIDGVYTKGKIPKWRKRGLSIVTFKNEQWGAPQEIKVRGYSRLNEGIESNVWMNSDRKVILFSFTHHYNGKRNNIYVSLHKADKWTKPKKLSKVINTRMTNEEAPFISYDNETLYFTSNRGAKTKQERKYNYQIFKSHRLDESWKLWSTPVALSDTINSSEWDSYFRTNAKGSWAYFASSKNSIGKSDIYRVKLFEENPFVVVKGKIINKAKHAPIKGKVFTVLADGQPIDSFFVTPDSSSYLIKLPLGKKYQIAASVKNFKGIPEEIDMSGVKEYTELEKDLMIEPMPYVLVSGNLLVQSPRGIIPESREPKIFINGIKSDSAKIRYPEGTYEIAIPYGKSYTIAVRAVKYVSDPVKLDFTKIDEYQELKKDLYVKLSPMALVKGTFLVKGSNVKIPAKAHPRLVINGEIVDSVKVDTINSTYVASLPIKKKYAVSVSAIKYQGIVDSVNLLSSLESLELTRNIYATPVSTSAILTGTIINRKNSKPIVNLPGVAIQSNGTDIPGVKVDPATGVYEAELSLGVVHTVNAHIANFIPQFEMIDLTKQKGNAKVLRDLYVTPLEVGLSVKLNNIFFETGKATLKPKSYPELNKVVKFLNEYQHVNIQIEGHTDNVGKPEDNVKLSRWRARSVQQYLVGKGIDIKRVKFDGFGQNKPVTKNTTAQGRSLNRRVEFKILAID